MVIDYVENCCDRVGIKLTDWKPRPAYVPGVAPYVYKPLTECEVLNIIPCVVFNTS